MNRVIQRIHDIGANAWLLLVHTMNWIAVSLLGGVMVVNSTYPGVISNAVNKLSPKLGIPGILIFGTIAHYAIRRARKAV